MSLSLAALRGRLVELHAELTREYGWTRLDLDLALDESARRLRVWGPVAALGSSRRVRAALAELLPADYAIELDLAVLEPAAWHALVDITPVWRGHPDAIEAAELATELWIDDGPVGVLARDRGATLVRARDGTVGWTRDVLGLATRARPIECSRQADGPAVVVAARTWLGTPYLLGGSTREHIDCSALIQRAFVEALDLVVPKNSNDQLACTAGRRGELEAEAGDLVFIHSRRERRTHVGIAASRGRVVHASRTRGEVVEVSVDEYVADAGWVAWTPLAEWVEWGRGQVGREVIELPQR